MADRPLNVMQFIGSLQLGGAEKVVVTLLKCLDRGRFNLHLGCFHDQGGLRRDVVELGVPIHPVAWSKRRPWGLLSLVRLLRELEIDVLHTHLFHADVPGRLAAWLAGTPVAVSTLHASSTWKTAPGLSPRLRTLLDRVTANHLSTRLLAVAPGVREYHVRVGIRAGLIDVLPNPVLLEGPSQGFDRAAMRASLGLAPDDRVVINVANLNPIKGQRYLVEAVASLKGLPGPRVCLLVAGEGPLKGELESLAASLGVGDRVRLLGHRRDIGDLLAASDVFCLSSLSEGVSIALLEAMLAARPVVATRVGGNPEVVADGETGLLVPHGDVPALASALGRLVTDEALAARFAEAGRESALRRYEARSVAAELGAIYERLYQEARRDAR